MPDSGFWRTEIWHPLSVHFPIALLLASAFVLLAATVLKKDHQAGLWKSGSGLLVAGCVTIWLAIYTGDMAEGIVARKICDPTVLKQHEIYAFRASYLFSAGAIMNLIILLRAVSPRLLQLLRVSILILVVGGSGFLIYAGHLGATLVYQQGAGVSGFTSDCTD